MTQLIQLYKWNGKTVGNIVFVHGLQGDAYTTWQSENVAGQGSKFWPEWIGEEFPGLNVWTISYDAPISNWYGNALPLTDTAETVHKVLCMEEALKGLPLIFVCHSMGGLVIKEVIRTADGEQNRREESKNLLQETKGIVFAATPHFGSVKATLLDKFRLLIMPSPAALSLVKNDPNLRKLNTWFRNRVCETKYEVFYETVDTIFGNIVDPGSADGGLPMTISLPVPGADHMGIVKPTPQQPFIHNCVVALVKSIVTNKRKNPTNIMEKLPTKELGKIRKLFLVPLILRLVLVALFSFVGVKTYNYVKSNTDLKRRFVDKEKEMKMRLKLQKYEIAWWERKTGIIGNTTNRGIAQNFSPKIGGFNLWFQKSLLGKKL